MHMNNFLNTETTEDTEFFIFTTKVAKNAKRQYFRCLKSLCIRKAVSRIQKSENSFSIFEFIET